MSAATEIRGALAAKLTCWHRLTGQEAGQLVHLHLAQNAELDARQAKINALQMDAKLAGQLVLTVRSWDSVDSDSDDASCEIEKLSQALGDYDAAMDQSKQGGA